MYNTELSFWYEKYQSGSFSFYKNIVDMKKKIVKKCRKNQIGNCETLKFLQMHMQMKHYTKARSRYIRLVAVLRC